MITYGDRVKYFEKVLARLESFTSIHRIVVVCNAISPASLERLNTLNEKSGKLRIHDMGYNSGSALGFKEGLLCLQEEPIDFIWLLDDDNLPEKDSLNRLMEFWPGLSLRERDLCCLLSYRPDRKLYRDAVVKRDPYLMLGPENSFLGFSLKEMLKRQFRKREAPGDTDVPEYGQVAVAPYGGMFFPKSLLEQIGLPDESKFLYADDHEFSYRITKKGGKILLLLTSKIEDLEKSFHLKQSNNLFNIRYIRTDSKIAIYYSVRNNAVFEKNFVTSPLTYFFNKYLYLFMLSLLMLINIRHLWKLPLIVKAVRAANKISRDDKV